VEGRDVNLISDKARLREKEPVLSDAAWMGNKLEGNGMTKAVRWFAVAALLFFGSAWAVATDWLPGGTYDPDVPEPAAVLGYEIGTRLTDHYQMLHYMNVLDRASPRVRIYRYGYSLEGREMILVIISEPGNLERLEEIRKKVARFKDPRRLTPEQAETLAETVPAIAWLNYANDGNESAAFETSMQMAYQLAAGTDEHTQTILKNLIVIINPAHNPESHQRHVAWYRAVRVGPGGTPDPQASEHRGDWLMSTNNNHYQIDLNRDAFILSQRESQLVAREFHRWNPQLFIDHHGETDEFFFPPNVSPVNMNLPAAFKKWTRRLGKAIARACDAFGWSYYTSEHFDLHYPGFWDSYPSLNGAIGMTFETDGGGRKGLSFRKKDGTVVTLRDGVRRHFTGGFAALLVCAENRGALLRYFYDFHRTALEELRRWTFRGVVLLPGKDPGRLRDLLKLLNRHAIEFYRLEGKNRLRGQSYFDRRWRSVEIPPSAIWVPFVQPQGRLVKTLFEPDPPLEPEFLQRARELRDFNLRVGYRAPKKRLGFYDVTAWALPVLYGVKAFLTVDEPGSKKVRGKFPSAESGMIGEKADFGYAFSGQTNAGTRLAVQLIGRGFRLLMSTRTVRIGRDSLSPGSYVVRTERNPDSLHSVIRRLADQYQVKVYAVSSAWSGGRISLASPDFIRIRRPRIAVMSGGPVRQTSFGSVWCLLEQEYGVRFTALRFDYFSSVDLREYDVLIFPDGRAKGYARILGKEGIEKIRSWVRTGGVFIGLKGGAEFAALPEVRWTTARIHPRRGQKVEKAAVGDTAAACRKKELPPVDFTPGALLRVEFEPAYFLTMGFTEPTAVMVYSDLVLAPSESGVNAVRYAEENLRVSGFVWEETLPVLAGKSYLIDEYYGRGHVILFADDPTFRLFCRSLDRLFLRAIFVAPSVKPDRRY
jgi:hypothetical protein